MSLASTSSVDRYADEPQATPPHAYLLRLAVSIEANLPESVHCLIQSIPPHQHSTIHDQRALYRIDSESFGGVCPDASTRKVFCNTSLNETPPLSCLTKRPFYETVTANLVIMTFPLLGHEADRANMATTLSLIIIFGDKGRCQEQGQIRPL
jgi:hypothetical protein